MTRPPQRLTCVPCEVCGTTTRAWSKRCGRCTKAAQSATSDIVSEVAVTGSQETKPLVGGIAGSKYGRLDYHPPSFAISLCRPKGSLGASHQADKGGS